MGLIAAQTGGQEAWVVGDGEGQAVGCGRVASVRELRQHGVARGWEGRVLGRFDGERAEERRLLGQGVEGAVDEARPEEVTRQEELEDVVQLIGRQDFQQRDARGGRGHRVRCELGPRTWPRGHRSRVPR